MEEDEPIEHNMISRAIENAQRKVEGHNFDIRKHLLEYDDVMNKQREVIYRQRREVLEDDNVAGVIQDMIAELVEELVAEVAQDRVDSENWDWKMFDDRLLEIFNIPSGWSEEERRDLKTETLLEKTLELVRQAYRAQEERNGEETQRQLEKLLLLQMVDNHWKDHLLSMDHLKEGIGLRGYGQKNPLNEYKREGFQLFTAVIHTVKVQTVANLMRVRVIDPAEVERLEEERRRRHEQEMLAEQAIGRGRGRTSSARPAGRRQDRQECRLPLRFGKEIQEVLRTVQVTDHPFRCKVVRHLAGMTP